jgi:hypothetical protein
MRHSMLVVLLVVSALVVACGEKETGSSGDPVGHWAVDWEASLPSFQEVYEEETASLPESDRPKAAALFEAQKRQLRGMKWEYDLHSDGTFTALIQDPAGTTDVTAKGTWKHVPGGVMVEGTEGTENGEVRKLEGQDPLSRTFLFEGDNLVSRRTPRSKSGFVLEKK